MTEDVLNAVSIATRKCVARQAVFPTALSEEAVYMLWGFKSRDPHPISVTAFANAA